MTIIEAITLGIIQGLTEFLPISSSAHLVLSQAILGIQIPGNDFEVLLHIGTLCSILVVFNNDIKIILFWKLNLYRITNLKQQTKCILNSKF